MLFLKTFCIVLMFGFSSCGGGYEDSGYTDPNPTPPPEESQKFVAIKQTIKAECARCHNGSVHPLDFNNENSWAKSNAKNRISNGSMPPDKRLSPDSKTTLLSYFL